jgi:1-acyl-sn-glycerol-3-phosphate acyltransferase
MNIPFWGWAMRLQKPIAIDRSQPREAGRSLLTQGVERIKEGNSVIVFPEGTRSSPGMIRRFSRGGAKLAVAAGVPIVPIAHNAGGCWPARTFLKRPGTISVVIGEPVPSAEKDATALTTQIEHWIRQQLPV